jgi:SAM-dependent methyltransferase
VIRTILGPLLDRLPASLRLRLRTAIRRWPVVGQLGVPPDYRQVQPGTVKWGSLRRKHPFSRSWGYDRGTPIDRIYIEQFLAEHAGDVRGSCLEVLNGDYVARFGGSRVTRCDVLDIDPANANATIVADLGEADSLPAGRFDCVVFTQTLHLVPDMRTAMANVWRALAPGGVLLLTVPVLGRHDTHQGFHHDRWRVTRTGLEWLIVQLPGARPATSSYGNLVSCAAFLYGLAAEELSPEELSFCDPQFPLIVAARVCKDSSP